MAWEGLERPMAALTHSPHPALHRRVRIGVRGRRTRRVGHAGRVRLVARAPHEGLAGRALSRARTARRPVHSSSAASGSRQRGELLGFHALRSARPIRTHAGLLQGRSGRTAQRADLRLHLRGAVVVRVVPRHEREERRRGCARRVLDRGRSVVRARVRGGVPRRAHSAGARPSSRRSSARGTSIGP